MKIFLFIALSLILTSCSHIYGDHGAIKNHEKDYLKAQSIPHLKTPPGVPAPQTEERFPVPQHTYPEPQKTISLIPPGLNSAGNGS